MQPEILELKIDKFTFRVRRGLWYTEAGAWAEVDASAGQARVGLSDFRQQSSGDIAFAEVFPAGIHVAQGEGMASLETVKVDVGVVAPVTGVIQEVNPALADAPECITEDPYGAGWLAIIRLERWEADQAHLLAADAYFAVTNDQADAAAA